MPLILIAEKETERHALEEAFKYTSRHVESHACFEEVKTIGEDSFILTTDVLEKAKKYVAQRPVFLISDEDVEDNNDFEDVFVRPLRLGHVAELIDQVMKQQALHKALSLVRLGNIILNPKTSHIEYGDKSIRLTEKELAVLIFLSQQKGVAVPRQKLLDEVWDYAVNVETHTLETHIYRLRQKLQTQLGLNDFLVTKDEGYVLKF